ncbi:MAG: InlB B-repeat-containing protein, partial [Clostridia bacterium]|nr:InlB B-repeat-containing protein [Clostridia bacterium]
SMTYLEINRYAHWEKRCRLLYYDGTTKKYTDENLNIPADETTGLYDTYDFIPNKTLTKAGYFFKGWSLENGSDVLVSSINSSAFTELNNDTFVMNVYAVWEPKTYTVTWDLNDGDFVHGAEVLTHPDPLSVTLTQADVDAMTGDYQLGTASATGYKFLKWKTTYDDGSSEELNASTTENQYIAKSWFNRSRTGLFAAKAQWQAQYTLAFDANAGGDTVTGMPVDHERTVTEAVNSNSGYGAFSATVPSRNGYTFMGWALDPAGNEMITGKTVSNSFYVRKDAFTTPIADPPSFEATLYAIWAKNVTVTFDYNGGVLSSDGTTTILQKNGNTAETIRVAENQHLGDPAFEWTGHTFVKKWNTEPDGSGTEYTAGDNVIFSDDTTLYAMWQAKFRLTYQPNAEGVEGMPQFGYNESTFRLSEVETASISIKEGQNNGPKMRGYVFKGWSLTADGSQMVQNGYEPLGSVPLKNNFTWDATNNYYAGTVYAIWEILEYQIQLESGLPDGVTFSGMPNNLPDDHILTFTYEQIKDGYQAHDLTAAGYQFLGWNVPNKTTSNGLEPDVEGSDYVTIDDSYIVGRAQPVVLTAQWNKLYSVHYDANLGAHGALTTSTATPGDEPVQRRRPADLEYVFTPSTIIRDDNYKRGDDTDNDGTIDQTYTFMGWSLSDDNDVSKKITNIPDSGFTQATVDSATNRHSFTIYAIWKANVILTYHAQGGYFTDNGGDTLIVDSKAIQTTGPSQWDVGTHWNGHTLLGWNTKPDGSGKYYISWKVNSSDSVKNVNMLKYFLI